MQEALNERIANAIWNLTLFKNTKCNTSYSYLIGMAEADLKVATDIVKELQTDVA